MLLVTVFFNGLLAKAVFATLLLVIAFLAVALVATAAIAVWDDTTALSAEALAMIAAIAV